MSFSRKLNRHLSVADPKKIALQGEARAREILSECSTLIDSTLAMMGPTKALIVMDPQDHDAREYWIKPFTAALPTVGTPVPGSVLALPMPREALIQMREAEGHADAEKIRSAPPGHHVLFIVAGGCSLVAYRKIA